LNGAQKVVLKDCYELDGVDSLSEKLAVSFEGTLGVDAESLEKLSQCDLSKAVLVFESKEGLAGKKLPEVAGMVIGDEANQTVYVLGEKEKLKIAGVDFSEAEAGGIKVNFVSAEEMEAKTGAVLTKNVEKEEVKSALKTAKAEEVILDDAAKQASENMAAKTTNATEKVVAEAAAKTATKEVAKQSAQKGNRVISAALEANAKFDAAVDKTVEKGAQVLNNSALGKAYAKTSEKVSQTAAAKAVKKTTKKVATKAANTAAGKAAGKAAAKVAGSAVTKSALKKIPLVAIGVGAYFAAERLMAGEYVKAGGELTSGVLGTFPGVGTAASVAIDASLVASDVNEMLTDSNSVSVSEEDLNKRITSMEKFDARIQARQQIEVKSDNTYVAPKYVAPVKSNTAGR
jgi:hypothetical protein